MVSDCQALPEETQHHLECGERAVLTRVDAHRVAAPAEAGWLPAHHAFLVSGPRLPPCARRGLGGMSAEVGPVWLCLCAHPVLQGFRSGLHIPGGLFTSRADGCLSPDLGSEGSCEVTGQCEDN